MAREISRLESMVLATIATTTMLAASAGIAYYGVRYFYNKLEECKSAAEDSSRYAMLNEKESVPEFRDGACPEKEWLK